MNKTLLILIFILCNVNLYHCFTMEPQEKKIEEMESEKIRLRLYSPFDLGGGITFGQSGISVSANILNYAISPYKASPYPRVLIGTNVLEFSLHGDLMRGTLFPLYVYFIPFMRLAKWSIQPISHVEGTYEWIKYYYNPYLSEDLIVAKYMFDIFISGHLLSVYKYKPEIYEENEDLTYVQGLKPPSIKCGAELNWFFKIEKKPMLSMDMFLFGISYNILIMPNFHNTNETRVIHSIFVNVRWGGSIKAR